LDFEGHDVFEIHLTNPKKKFSGNFVHLERPPINVVKTIPIIAYSFIPGFLLPKLKLNCIKKIIYNKKGIG